MNDGFKETSGMKAGEINIVASGSGKSLIAELTEEIERLKQKCDKQAMILRRLTPENFPGFYFIHGDGGSKDINGLPERLYVVPSYGCDWSQVYERTEKMTGPEW